MAFADDAADPMTDQVNREILRRELKKVFSDKSEVVAALSESAVVDVILEALRDASSGPTRNQPSTHQ